ncbi:hypothetical protein [Yoonia sediminilitoris]|uniref:Uncharacterized protein n=1 Tax=Yoonia sediminilitoris TaxID=1286148 RepID=A0A2T6K5Q6_9RHOB|nr:hypothetical protein [Yoonia sediminilitoris]PUB09971.1 hypothetical protein C8N45_12323 [Yoonia sediminilitoris]RCW89640.1 hypothetical protein DFP92_12323 [Yoonia sediminilitoris]
MSKFNEMTRWSNLARLAGGRTAKLTIAAPFAAFIILHNEPLQPFLEMSENWHPNPILESLALARFDIFYLGLVVIGIAVALFSLFSPLQITSHEGYNGFISLKERTKTNNAIEGSLRLTLEEYSRCSRGTDLSVDTSERRFRFPKRFREGLWSLLVGLSRATKKQGNGVEGHYSPKEILAGLTAEGPNRADWWETVHELLPDFSIDIFRLEFVHADYASPIMRAIVFWVLILGILIVFLPTVITTYLVLSDLVQLVKPPGSAGGA